MTQLTTYTLDGDRVLATDDPARIAATLSAIGVRFEQWPSRSLPADADPQAVLAAFAPEVARLQAENGYRTVDVIRMTPEHPERAALRDKFLSEHRHSEDEVRFFVEGEGLFTLREADRVHAVLCEAGDLISVPAGMRHWFDMGPTPRFTAIRLFVDPAGWVANFTGDAIAERFPRHEPALMPAIAAILLDIEGTTSSISFVADVLFPYARAHLRDFVAMHADTVAPILAEVPGDDPVATLLEWMDADRKATPLKTLQGRIWARGYADGTLEGHVYPDTPAALRRWRAAGIPVHLYSSGSIAAQQLLFRHSIAGDLTPLIGDYFDTTSGPKREAASYAAIATALGLAPVTILFVSDVQAEVDAARAAGLQALLIAREGGGDVRSLAEILP